MKKTFIKRKIGNQEIWINNDHKLPFYLKEFLMYDKALPRISIMLNDIDGYLKVVDIGANIGDTVCLITEKTQGSFLCVEGDAEYVELLSRNVNILSKKNTIVLENVYCSDLVENNFSVTRQNGTAMLSRQKDQESVNAKFSALDEIIKSNNSFDNANLIKIDTDGFEINVLNSGINFVQNAKPLIFFEFDPKFYADMGHDNSLIIFEILRKQGYVKALFYDNFGFPIEVVDIFDTSRIKELVEYIDMKNIFYYDVLAVHGDKYEKYKQIFDLELLNPVKVTLHTTTQQLNTTTQQLNSTTQQLNSTTQQLNTTTQQLNTTTQQLNSTTQQLHILKTQLNNIHNSREYKIGLKIQKIFKLCFPIVSVRRKILVKFVNFTKKSSRLFKKIKTFLYIFVKSSYYKSKLKKIRQINKKAKKIVYVGHSYHNKTKSTIFLQKYLEKFWDVEIISDNSWSGGEYPDLSFINKDDYVGVVFFQLLPSEDVLDSIDSDNIIFFPMYDQSVRCDFNYWDQYRNLKIINFSKTLHIKLKRWGFESMYIQYFPKVQKFIPGKKDEIFFWQRLSCINIKTVIKLLDGQNTKINLHKAIDPNQEFLQPTKKEELKYKITYSEWFDTREEMQQVIKQKGIYIAPREYEGIGQSFIEAMSMGKAVIAVNNPTMNEYIKHGETGYLFDLKNPQKINLSDIAQVQENAYNYMKDGRMQWKQNRKNIIDFIKKD